MKFRAQALDEAHDISRAIICAFVEPRRVHVEIAGRMQRRVWLVSLTE
jgi:hypothetical protein